MAWLIELVQKSKPENPRYHSESVVGGLTVTERRAARYDSRECAQSEISKLPPHPWGKWEPKEKAA
jgi:hypothetical protein